jgi:hypothetical protein
VGGKNVHDGMVTKVEEFVRTLLMGTRTMGYEKHFACFDQNYRQVEK